MAIILQGFVLMVSGMGIVYLFLALLVWVMSSSARIVPRFNHILPDEQPKKKARAAARATASSDDALIALVIAAAQARAA